MYRREGSALPAVSFHSPAGFLRLFLFLASMGYIEGRKAPIITDGIQNVEAYINPVPAGLVLTGIVVSVSVTAVMLSLSIRLYKRYHTLDLDDVYLLSRHQTEDR